MTTTVASPAATAEVAIIPLADIRRSGNVRQDLGDIESLASSIRQHGVLTAVLVERHRDGGFDLVAGFRRVAAAETAGLERIPAVVRDPVASVQRVSDQLAENDDRCALSELEVAGAMQQMLDLGASVDEVAQRFDTNTDVIDRWRTVLALPAPLLGLVRDGTIAAGDVADIGELADDESFVDAVVREVRGGSSPRWAVKRVRQERELAAAAAISRATLEADGCPEVAAPRYDAVTTNSKMQRLGEGVKVSLRRHRKLPCHAAFINARGETVYVCTDRRRHAGEAGSGVLDLTAERAAKRAATKELRDAAPVRAGALRAALDSGAVAHDDAVRHILITSLWDAHMEELEDACGLLELTLPEEGWGVSRPLGVLLGHAGDDLGQLTTVVLAVQLARAERRLATQPSRSADPHVVDLYAEFVGRTSIHQMGDAERALVAERGLSQWSECRALLPPAAGSDPSEDSAAAG
jgi:ParB family chromosome partitioning protein